MIKGWSLKWLAVFTAFTAFERSWQATKQGLTITTDVRLCQCCWYFYKIITIVASDKKLVKVSTVIKNDPIINNCLDSIIPVTARTISTTTQIKWFIKQVAVNIKYVLHTHENIERISRN